MAKDDGRKMGRSEVDDVYRRNLSSDSYKNRYFGTHRSAADEYTGDRIYYGSKNHYSTAKTANVDHIVPVDELIERYGESISKDELKRIANSDYNLAVTAERLNKAKGGSSNLEYLARQIRKGDGVEAGTALKMAGKEAYAEFRVATDAAFAKGSEAAADLGRKVGSGIDKGLQKAAHVKLNAADSLASAAKVGGEAAMITLLVSATNNLAQVGAGKKSAGEAVKDVAVECGGTFVSAGGMQLTQNVVGKVCQTHISKNVGKFIATKLPLAEISLGIMVAHNVLKYANGEMNGEECATAILMGGLGVVACEVGALFGGPAGAVVASLVVGKIAETILTFQEQLRQQRRLAAEREARFRRVVREAMTALDGQKKVLEKLQIAEREKFTKAFAQGADQIKRGILQDNVEYIAAGLDSYLSVFNKSCAFKTLDEFNAFFDDENAVLVL